MLAVSPQSWLAHFKWTNWVRRCLILLLWSVIRYFRHNPVGDYAMMMCLGVIVELLLFLLSYIDTWRVWCGVEDIFYNSQVIWMFETDFWDLPFSRSFINSSFTIFKGLKVRWMPWIFLVQILPLTVISLCYNLYNILHQCHKILFEYNVINLETNKYRISIISAMKMMLPSLGLIYCVLSKSPHPASQSPRACMT